MFTKILVWGSRMYEIYIFTSEIRIFIFLNNCIFNIIINKITKCDFSHYSITIGVLQQEK